jgi:hypothetical protein
MFLNWLNVLNIRDFLVSVNVWDVMFKLVWIEKVGRVSALRKTCFYVLFEFLVIRNSSGLHVYLKTQESLKINRVNWL